MISYKQHIFISFLDEIILNESANYSSNTTLVDLLLEAPIDDSTVKKMIDSKKQVSLYYQGDSKLGKAWYTFYPVKVKSSDGKNYVLGYAKPKGGDSVLSYLEQDKIVNWDVLGSKSADDSKAYDKKLFKFFADPKIPKEKKEGFKNKLGKVGIPFKKIITTASLISVLLGGVKFNSFVKDNVHAQAFKEFATLRTKTFTEKDLKESDKEALKDMLDFYSKNPKKYTSKGGNVNFYNIANDMNKSGEDQLDFRDKKSFGLNQSGVKSDYTKVALLIGNATSVETTKDGYRVKDKYDFNQYYKNPEQYNLSNFPKKSVEIIKYFGNGNLVKGFEELGNYYEKFGYKGFPVSIFISKS